MVLERQKLEFRAQRRGVLIFSEISEGATSQKLRQTGNNSASTRLQLSSLAVSSCQKKSKSSMKEDNIIQSLYNLSYTMCIIQYNIPNTKLNRTQWLKTKKKASKKIHREAIQILELYKPNIKIVMISILFRNIRRWTVTSEYWNL